MIVIDRFEGDDVWLEDDGVTIKVKHRILPDDAREGDVLKQIGDAYETDPVATRARKALIAEKRKRAFT